MEISIYTWKKVGYISDKVEELEREFPDLKVNLFEKGDRKDYGRSVFIMGVDMTSEELEEAREVKEILVPYTGLNQFPVEEIKERGIKIEGSHAKARYVAEKGLSLLLGIMGKVCEYDSGLRRGSWGPRSGMKNHWESLFGKRIGMLGAGHIGQEFIRLTSPFTGKFAAIERGKKYPGIETYYRDIGEMAENVDILFMSLPLNRYTTSIIDEKVLKKFEGYIINVGRGKTIEEKALYEALKNKEIKGAGIEVWYNYPKGREESCFPSDYPFHELDNIIMSPHVATSNVEDRWIYFEDTFEKLKKLIEEEMVK